jgi:hypothetical protein
MPADLSSRQWVLRYHAARDLNVQPDDLEVANRFAPSADLLTYRNAAAPHGPAPAGVPRNAIPVDAYPVALWQGVNAGKSSGYAA